MATITSLGYTIFSKYDGRGVKNARNDLKGFAGRLDRFGQKARKAGAGMSMAVTAPMIAGAAQATSMAADFDREMTKIQGLVGVSQKQLKSWEGDMISMASQFGKSGQEAAEAMFFITSAGLEGKDAMNALKASLKASASGLGETKVVADLVTSSMNAYKQQGLTAGQATDVLTAAVREGKLEAADLAGSMGRVLPIASQMGISMADVGSSMAAMSRTGTDAETATTQLRAIMTSLLKPAAQSEQAMKEMGLSSQGLRTQIKEEGLLSVLQTLSDKFDGNKAKMAQVFPNVRALSGFMDMMGGNAKSTEQIFGELNNSTGSLNQAFNATSESGAFKMEKAMATLKNTGLQIGQILLPLLSSLVAKLQPVIDWFGRLSPRMQLVIVAVAGLVAAIGPLLIIIGLVSSGIAALTAVSLPLIGTIALVVAAVAGLTAAIIWLWNNTTWFKNAVVTAWNAIRTAAVVAWNAIVAAAQWAWNNILKPIFNAWVTYMRTVVMPVLRALWNGVVKPIFTLIANLIRATWNNILKPVFEAMVRIWRNHVGPAVQWLWNNIIQPVFSAIGEFISFWWSNVVGPVFRAVLAFISNTLGPVFNWLWQNIIQPAFQAIGLIVKTNIAIVEGILRGLHWFFENVLAPVIRWWWNNVVEPVFKAVGSFIAFTWNNVIKPTLQALQFFIENFLVPVIRFLWNTVVKPVFRMIGEHIKWVWNNIIKPPFNALVDFIEHVINPAIKWLWQNIVRPMFQALGVFIEWVWDTIIEPAFEAMKSGLDTVGNAFETAVDTIKSAWNKVKEAAAAPIRWVIDTVYNKGIVGVWNAVADKVPGVEEIDPFKPKALGFAGGGVIPGYQGQKKDEVSINARKGEGVLVPEVERGIPGLTNHLNGIANSRGVQGVKNAFGFASGGVIGGAPGFSLGGFVGDAIDKVKGTAKNAFATVKGGITGMFENFSNPAVDKMKDKFGTGQTFESMPVHVMNAIIDKLTGVLSTKDNEMRSAGGYGDLKLAGGLSGNTYGGTRPHVALMGNLVEALFPGINSIGGVRADPLMWHPSGRSLDIMTGRKTGLGDRINSFLMDHMSGLGLDHTIWKQRLWRGPGQNRKMADRGGPTQNHMDHIHTASHASHPLSQVRKVIDKARGGISGGGGGGGGSGNTVLTHFWDAFQPTASGKRMSNDTIASSVIPLGTKLRVKAGGNSVTGTVDDLGPNSFVYRRHHPKALLDLATPLMRELTGSTGNVMNASFDVLSRGSGRTLFGYTNWNGKFSPGRGTNGFAEGGQMRAGETAWVGEKGPELFTAGGSGGHVTANKDLGGDTHIHLHGNVFVKDKREFRRMVTTAVDEARRRGDL